MSRKKYINAYETVYEVDEHGRENRKIEYRGEYFEVSLDQPGLKRFRNFQVGLFILLCALHIAMGLFDSSANRTLYVSVPYAIAFIPIVYWGFGIFRLPRKIRQFRLEEIGLSFARIKTTTLAIVIIIGVCVLGTLVYLVFFAKEWSWLNIYFLAGELGVLGLSITARIIASRLKINKIATAETD